MRHQEYKGYPTEFVFLCKEGEKAVVEHAVIEQRKNNRYIDSFFVEMELHGYDIYTQSDGSHYEKALSDLNDGLRRYYLLLLNFSEYEKILSVDEICRCGKWIFLKRNVSNLERDYVPAEKGRGGKREGSGRKSNNQKLSFSKTTNIRVPEVFRDFLKNMSDFLILKAEEGIDIKQVLSNAEWQLHQAADNYRKSDYTSDVTDEWAKECDQAEDILKEIRQIIPWFSLKKDK